MDLQSIKFLAKMERQNWRDRQQCRICLLRITGENIAKFGKKGKTLLQEGVLILHKICRPKNHFNASTNVDPGIILGSEACALKVSINSRGHLQADSEAIRLSSGLSYYALDYLRKFTLYM